MEKARTERKISVKLRLSDGAEGVLLEATDEDGVQAVYEYKCERFMADKPDQAHDNICRQLAKMGNTHYACQCVTVDTTHAYFFPTFVLNSLRRFVLDELTKKRLEQRPALKGTILKNDIPYPESRLSFENNVFNQKARDFYKRHGVNSIEPAAETGLDMRGRRVMQTRYCIRYEMDICKKFGQSKQEPSQLFLLDDDGNKYRLEFDCRECRMDIRLI
jgi:putative protease